MRKSGTGWYFNMTNEVLQAAGGRDVHAIRQRPWLRGVIRGNNCTVGPLRGATLARLALPAGGAFAVKSHAAPTPSLRAFLATSRVRATYLYRDPRDVILSALDHAEAAREAGVEIDLARRLNTLDDSIDLVKRELKRWEQWMQCPHVLKVRYEDLVADTPGEMRRLVNFLDLDVADETLHGIVAAYGKEVYAKTIARPIIGNRLHLNKGIPGRFRREMSAEARARCERHLAPYLQKMGYV